MSNAAFARLTDRARKPEERKATAAYLTENLKRFVKNGEKVLICFPNREPDAISGLLEKAVVDAGAVPLFWGPDFRWKALLRLAFSHRPNVIIGPPLVLLGLTKISRAAGTPLSVRHVVTAGYPCLDWMKDGIIRGLDCTIWGVFGPGTGAIVSGFSCGKSSGVHLRSDLYDAQIMDERGEPAPEGALGDLILWRKDEPQTRFVTQERARLSTDPCPCGCDSPRLWDLQADKGADQSIVELRSTLHQWTSILDCKIQKGESGLELEVITFPGEKLPVFPACAKRIVRPWDPEKDEPFWYAPRPANEMFF